MPPLGFAEERIAAVDNHVAGREQRDEFFDELIDRRPGLDHQHHLPRRRQAADQFFQRVAADEVFALGPPGQQVVDLAGGAVINSDAKPSALDIQSQVFAHHGQADQSDVAIGGHGKKGSGVLMVSNRLATAFR